VKTATVYEYYMKVKRRCSSATLLVSLSGFVPVLSDIVTCVFCFSMSKGSTLPSTHERELARPHTYTHTHTYVYVCTYVYVHI